MYKIYVQPIRVLLLICDLIGKRMRFPHEPVTVKTLASHMSLPKAGRRGAHESKSGDLPEFRGKAFKAELRGKDPQVKRGLNCCANHRRSLLRDAVVCAA